MFVPDTDSGQYWWLANIAASPEDEFITVVTKLLGEKPPGVAIDVGANFGCWSLPLARHAVEVHAFEPQKCCHDLIVRTLQVNPEVANVVAYHMAVGSRIGHIAVPDLDIETDGNFGGVTLVEGAAETLNNPMIPTTAKSRRVRLVTLDSLFVSPTAPVSFIKIDVEGMELDVLHGAYRTIARDRPILMMEMDHALTDLAALEGFLVAAGYGFDQYGPNYLCMPLFP
jgi:FkbM family methyltransferase